MNHILEYFPIKPFNYKDLQLIYEKYHLKCISDLFLNQFSNLVFECQYNHVFQSTIIFLKFTKFKCPVCNSIEKNNFIEVKFKTNQEIIPDVQKKYLKEIESQFLLLKQLSIFYNNKPNKLTPYDFSFLRHAILILIKEFLKKFEHAELDDLQINYISNLFIDIIFEIFQLTFEKQIKSKTSILLKKITIKNKELIMDKLNCISIYDFRKYFENLDINQCSKFIVRCMQISIRTKPLIYYYVKQKVEKANIPKYLDSALFLFHLLNDSDFKLSYNANIIAGSIYKIVSENSITNAEYFRNFELTSNDCSLEFQSIKNKIDIFNKESNIFLWDDERLKMFLNLSKTYSPIIVSFILICSKKNLQEAYQIIDKQNIKNQTQLFNGSKFNLFAFDMSNLVNSYIHLKNIELNTTIDPLNSAVKKDLFKNNYQAWFFAQKHLQYLKNFYPENENNHWYLEEILKKNNQYVDVDVSMAGIISMLIEKYQNQIQTLYLGTGDKDMHILLDMAQKYKIKTSIIVISEDNLSQELRRNSNEIKILFN